LGEGDEVNGNAWPAALKLLEYAYGREPPHDLESVVLPESSDAVADLTWVEMRALAVKLLSDMPLIENDATTPNVVPPSENGA